MNAPARTASRGQDKNLAMKISARINLSTRIAREVSRWEEFHFAFSYGGVPVDFFTAASLLLIADPSHENVA
jgi:hypothetical protein